MPPTYYPDTCPAKNAELLSALLEPLLSNPYFFSSLYHGSKPPFLPDLEGPGSAHAFGFEQPHVRRSAWGTIQSLLTLHRGQHSVSLSCNDLLGLTSY